MKQEESLQIAISKYIKLQYPNVVFTSESSGIRVPIGVAAKMKAQRSRHKQLDMIILKPKPPYYGLVIELKDTKSSPFKKNGALKTNKHVEEQSETINLLSGEGYYATFAVGFDEARRVIDEYMKL